MRSNHQLAKLSNDFMDAVLEEGGLGREVIPDITQYSQATFWLHISVKVAKIAECKLNEITYEV
jgi:hypothetical protein